MVIKISLESIKVKFRTIAMSTDVSFVLKKLILANSIRPIAPMLEKPITMFTYVDSSRDMGFSHFNLRLLRSITIKIAVLTYPAKLAVSALAVYGFGGSVFPIS